MTPPACGPEKIIELGWREWVALPGLSVPHIKCKVDTGARTSALHATEIEAFVRRGVRHVRFAVHPLQGRAGKTLHCEAHVVDERWVSDSGGHRERRLVIWTPLLLGAQSWPIEVTLTRRDNMRFRMLLGRSAMTRHVTVLPGASYLTGRPPRRRRHRSG